MSEEKSQKQDPALKTKPSEKGFWEYYKNAFYWFAGNLVFGLFPLGLMILIEKGSNGKEGTEIIHHLIYQGGILVFVAIALMGAVSIDYALVGTKFTTPQVILIFIVPGCVMACVCLEYILVCFHVISEYALGISARKTYCLLLFSFLYCTFTKTNLYITEEKMKLTHD